MKIGYIIRIYPNLTTTFIYREVKALRALGIDVDVFSIWKPEESTLSPESRELLDSTFYIFPLSPYRLIVSHFKIFFRMPVRYIATLLRSVGAKGETPKNRRRTLGHFGQAVYFAEEIRKRGITHLHAHFAVGAASNALMISRLLGTSFSFSAHNTFFTDRILLKDKVREASFIAVISEFTKNYLLRVTGEEERRDNCRIVRCGVSPGLFNPSERKKQKKNGPVEILFVAQLAERKGAPFLVEACEMLVKDGISNFHCTIAGGGPQLELLRNMAERAGIEKYVSLPGAVFQEEVRELLKEADIFTLPCIVAEDGDIDGIPVSLMEAMAMEIPVISTTVSGIPELVDDGVNGFLVPEKNAAALADALKRLIRDKKFRIELGRNARLKILDEFDLEKNALRLATLFREMF